MNNTMPQHHLNLALGFLSVGGAGLSAAAVDIYVRIGSGIAAGIASTVWVLYTIHKWRKGQ